MKKLFFSAILGGLTLASCSSDDSPSGSEETLEIPSTYTFERDNVSTVDFNGQTTRLEMTSEILANFNDFDNASEELLLNMYANENSPFENSALNNSGKSVKSKVAASSLFFATNTVESSELKNDFENFIVEQMTTVKANRNELAEAGKAGQIAQGTTVRYVNEKGLELNQAFAKGLIGGLLADQILNNYLSNAVLDEGDNRSNNDAGITEDGKSYTTMEHKWDEAYGYLYGNPSIPAEDPNSVLNESSDRLLFSYLGQVDADEDFAGIAESTFEAFKTGRAAIVAGDYELRDEQVAIIRTNLSKVIGVRAVHYLKEGEEALAAGNYGSAFHALSEGYGFIYSLRFTNNNFGEPYLEPERVEALRADLLRDNGFWDLTSIMLNAMMEEITSKFDFSKEQA